jgi:hypothetical protein
LAQRYDDDQRPASPRPRGRWDDFVPQMLANAAGTLLAATVLYLYGVAVGAIKANWRVLAPIISAIVVTALFLSKLELDDRIDKRFQGPGLRRLVARNALSSLYSIPIFALAFLTVDFWSDRGLPFWGYLLTFLGLSLLGMLALRKWKLRRSGFPARTKRLD